MVRLTRSMTEPTTKDEVRPVAAAEGSPARGRARINPVIDRLGVTSWRLVGMGLVFVAVVWVLARLWVVVLAVAIATLFARAMNPVAVWLRARGMKPALVAATVMIGFTLVLAGIVAALVPGIASEFDELGPTIEQSIDDVEDWLVNDSPFDVSRQEIRDFRDDASDRISDTLSSSQASVVSGTMVAFEVITALILSLITAFFILKDGERFGHWLTSFVPDRHQPLAVRLARKAWWTLGGYLRGAAILGLVEGVIMGLTVWLAGGTLAIPIAVITFFAAFIPFAGAVVAGTIAVLVTLVTGGVGGALIVLVVAIVVQQLDSDLLAPFIYGRGLELHPLVVLFALAGGSALVGPVGALFAVPVTAVAINVIAEARAADRDGEVSPSLLGKDDPADGSADGDAEALADRSAHGDAEEAPPGVEGPEPT
jgi:predicted PurR-regulated permease PerM